MRLDPKEAYMFLDRIAIADVVMGRYTEAIPTMQQFLAHHPTMFSAHLLLAIAYIELGREREARAEAAEILRLNPSFSVKVNQARFGASKDPAIRERWAADLRSAGLK
jgi:adenylate cyclase